MNEGVIRDIEGTKHSTECAYAATTGAPCTWFAIDCWVCIVEESTRENKANAEKLRQREAEKTAKGIKRFLFWARILGLRLPVIEERDEGAPDRERTCHCGHPNYAHACECCGCSKFYERPKE